MDVCFSPEEEGTCGLGFTLECLAKCFNCLFIPRQVIKGISFAGEQLGIAGIRFKGMVQCNNRVFIFPDPDKRDPASFMRPPVLRIQHESCIKCIYRFRITPEKCQRFAFYQEGSHIFILKGKGTVCRLYCLLIPVEEVQAIRLFRMDCCRS